MKQPLCGPFKAPFSLSLSLRIQDSSEKFSPEQLHQIVRCYSSKGLEDEDFFEAVSHSEARFIRIAGILRPILKVLSQFNAISDRKEPPAGLADPRTGVFCPR